jgi:hypothetical protein
LSPSVADRAAVITKLGPARPLASRWIQKSVPMVLRPRDATDLPAHDPGRASTGLLSERPIREGVLQSGNHLRSVRVTVRAMHSSDVLDEGQEAYGSGVPER